ncbi:Tryptophanyl-tRNA synthetase (EC [Olavius sp. associated proteobacterium Delta 1]|nr:Tryptophanyl-tRNA synthetase (EC [Olavius sp. associated proteobacterium Delta 1]
MTIEVTVRRPRVFSGVQPSGTLHLGNYLGALRRWVELQDEKENYFCIVDMHAITMRQDPIELRRSTREVAALYLACGLDPQRSTIFVQSQVRAHAEGCWILNCVTPLGWLERMTQFKTKAKHRESVVLGLLDYPVLQAADILLYDAEEVPVGEDQKQHIELTRNIAQRFNHRFGDTFTLPQAVIPASGARIRALNDPMKKMSKSEAHVRGHAVQLLDTPDVIRAVIRRAVTDSGREIQFSDAQEKAGVNNLLEIYELLTAQRRDVIEEHFAGKGYGMLKKDLAEVVVEALRPIRKHYDALIADSAELDSILAAGADRARAVAEPKIEEIKRKVGFIVPQDTT